MRNVVRGVGLSGLATLILACVMTVPAAAVQIKTATVQFHAPKLHTPPNLSRKERDTSVTGPAEPSLSTVSKGLNGVRALNPQPLPP
jgi:hypothetical protein